MHEPMAQACLFFGFNYSGKSHLHLVGILAASGNEPEAVGYADAMGVGDNGRLAKIVGQHKVGCFSAYAGYLQKLLHCVGNLSAEPLNDHLCAQLDVPCLGAEKSAWLDYLTYFFVVGISQRLDGWKAGIEHLCDDIYTGIGALGGESCGKKQFVVFFRYQ